MHLSFHAVGSGRQCETFLRNHFQSLHRRTEAGEHREHQLADLHDGIIEKSIRWPLCKPNQTDGQV